MTAEIINVFVGQNIQPLVLIGVAVKDQIVPDVGLTPPDSHAVMHCQTLKPVTIPRPPPKAFRLRITDLAFRNGTSAP